uniref:hypothetical protein n=1 Tax=Bacteroides eggerthii TaxID=28111 RepID=UPI0029225F12|nr:hypothetical protein AUSP0117_00047 [uncultured phage]
MGYLGQKKIVYIFPLKGNSKISKKIRSWEKKFEYLDIVPTNHLSDLYENSELIVLYKISDYDDFGYKEQSVIDAKKLFIKSEAGRIINDDHIIINDRYDIIEKLLFKFNQKYQEEIINNIRQ